MKKLIYASLFWIFGVVAASSANAAIINLGVDINDDGSFDLLPFFAESNDGKNIFGAPTSNVYTISLDTKSVFGKPGVLAINSATLFIDVTLVNATVDPSLVEKAADVATVKVSMTNVAPPSLVGTMADNKPNGFQGETGDCTSGGYNVFGNSVSCIPVETGGITNAVVVPKFPDVDNSFFNITGDLLQALLTSTTFTLAFQNDALFDQQYGEARYRVDGFNIQADVTVVPEPSSALLLLTASVFGAGIRKRRAASTTSC